MQWFHIDSYRLAVLFSQRGGLVHARASIYLWRCFGFPIHSSCAGEPPWSWKKCLWRSLRGGFGLSRVSRKFPTMVRSGPLCCHSRGFFLRQACSVTRRPPVPALGKSSTLQFSSAALHEGQTPRPLKNEASTYFCPKSTHQAPAKPCVKLPHCR